ncbi:YncE family protein [Aurantimicrobium minutum]|uniref:Uncharacterized protein n=1 Tax=Aurantimicrobium minutum TaxID=708131 RepID=A0A173LV00_9MICO|nr:YncE family protein [Aurantimicrobium minutum]BAU98640.1 Uncharacterized protein AUMI_10970 [Aurantimicrobium minutum]
MRRLSGLSKVTAVLIATLGLIAGVAISASATPVLVSTIPAGDNPTNVALSSDGSRLYVMSESSKQLQYFDTSTNTVTATYTLSSITDRRITYIVLSPDGTKLYAAGEPTDTTQPSTIYVIDISGSTPVIRSTITTGRQVAGLAITPNGQTLYAANEKSGTISVINTVTNTVTATVEVTSTTDPSKKLMSPWRVTVSPNGQYYFVAFSAYAGLAPGYSGYASLKVSDNTVVSQTEFGLYPSPGAQPYGLAITSDGQFLYVSSTVSGATANSWIKKIAINPNGSFGSVATTANVPNTPADIALSADNSQLFVTTRAAGSKFMVYPTSTMSSPTVLTLPGVQWETMIAPSKQTSSHFAYVGAGGALWFSSPTITNFYLVGEYLGPNNQVLNETTGTAFSSAALTASGLSGTVTYSISPGLPSGLSFNSATGVISGTVTCALPTSSYTISGSDGTSTAVATVSLTVTGSDCSSAALANTGIHGAPLTLSAASLLIIGALAAFGARRLARKK